jgi:hypothetical protein
MEMLMAFDARMRMPMPKFDLVDIVASTVGNERSLRFFSHTRDH